MSQLIHTITALRDQIRPYKTHGNIVGFVPTMGALHAGHLSLVEAAKYACDRVVVSIFVNPLQFAANEDLDQYPNTLKQDQERLRDAGVDVIYLPTPEMMYPTGFSTAVSISGVSSGLCGDVRPHHFQGVATVVAKLFNQVQPDKAFFGEKDYQQLCVIRQMAEDLNMPIEIIGVPTMREEDGLAMSSRNAYLNEDARAIAPSLHKVLMSAAQHIAAGQEVFDVLDKAKEQLIVAGFEKVDYMELRDGKTLEPLASNKMGARLLSAARIRATRLIDNIAVNE